MISKIDALPLSTGGEGRPLATRVALAAQLALIPAGLAAAMLILRTQWKDQTLQAELPGYKEYTERVRYRLIPGVW